jgi:hypothetical protein
MLLAKWTDRVVIFIIFDFECLLNVGSGEPFFCFFFCRILMDGHIYFSSPVLQELTYMVLHSIPDAMPFWTRMGYAPADVCVDRRYLCKETQFMKKAIQGSKQNTPLS